MASEKWNMKVSAYYMESGLSMKKKKHGQLPSGKDMFKWEAKTR
jgi:hypothetical protein